MQKPPNHDASLTMPATLKNNTGSAMLFVLVLAVIASIIIGATTLTTRYTSKKSFHKRESTAALNIAEAGKEKILAQLRSRALTLSLNCRITQSDSCGQGTYSVVCSTSTSVNTATIYSTGICGTDTAKIEVNITIQDTLQRWIKGMVTAPTAVSLFSPIALLLTYIEIDGRDYDTSSFLGLPLGAGGIYGVSSGGTVTAGGTARIGGNTTPSQQIVVPGVTVEQFNDTVGYPQTPEEVLGLPSGSLNIYKVTSSLPATISGIIYCDTGYFFMNGSGILIVHNNSGTASLGYYRGHFKGLIIADRIDSLGGGSSILGALVILGRSGSHNFGTKAARLHYSSRMLARVMQPFYNTVRRTVNVVSWREMD